MLPRIAIRSSAGPHAFYYRSFSFSSLHFSLLIHTIKSHYRVLICAISKLFILFFVRFYLFIFSYHSDRLILINCWINMDTKRANKEKNTTKDSTKNASKNAKENLKTRSNKSKGTSKTLLNCECHKDNRDWNSYFKSWFVFFSFISSGAEKTKYHQVKQSRTCISRWQS